MKSATRFLLLSFCFFVYACNSVSKTPKENQQIQAIYTHIKSEFAPDKRVKLFAINFEATKDKGTLLKGKTTEKQALEILLDSLKANNIAYTSQVRVLPDRVLGDSIFAVGRNSVINIRSAPKHSAELGTQGLLGMSLKILDKEGDFYQVQTPDGYISWVDHGGITKMTPETFESWEQAPKIIYTQNTGYVYRNTTDNKIVSDIVFGGLLRYMAEVGAFYKVQYPDYRIGYIRKTESSPYSIWQENRTRNAESFIAKSSQLLGTPYLWGGTSTKGMDCSGFTKTVYLMHGFIIPRDASQQIMVGKIVDKALNFKGLEVGDLLFFGKKATDSTKQKVTHVGMWIGNNQFIHAAGNVRISSILSDNPLYDNFNKNRYLGSKRYLNSQDPNIISLSAKKKIKE